MWSKIRAGDAISPNEVASQLLKGRPASTVDISHYPALTKSLIDIKNRAILKGDKSLRRRIDRILDELDDKMKSHTSRSSLKRTKHQPEVPVISPELDAAADEIIAGNDIEEIDPSIVPDLRRVLKQRQAEAIKCFDYDAAKTISLQLDKIHTLCEREKNSVQPTISKEKEQTLLEGIQAREVILRKLQDEYEADIADLYRKREDALAQAEHEYHAELEALMQERERVNDGIDFKPSSELTSLRRQEEALATSRKYEEATKLHECADEMERRERVEYDQRMTLILTRKQRRIETQRRNKLRAIDDFWETKKMKVGTRYHENAGMYAREIETIRGRLLRFGVHVPVNDFPLDSGRRNEADEEERETVTHFRRRLEKVVSEERYRLNEMSPERREGQKRRSHRGIMSSINFLTDMKGKSRRKGVV